MTERADDLASAFTLSWGADVYHRCTAAHRLRELKIANPDVMAMLLRLADDKDSSVRSAAIGALRELGPAAKEALPTIKYLLRYERREPGNREPVVLALFGIDPAVTHWRPEFATLMLVPERSMGRRWAHDFRKTVEDHPELHAAQLSLLDDFDPLVKAAAATAIGQAAVPLPGAEAKITRLLQSDEPLVRWNAAIALGRIASDKTKAAESLRPLLKDPDATVRLAAGISLVSLKQPSPEVFSVLANSLAEMDLPDDGDQASMVAISAMDTLADHSPNTREAMLALRIIGRRVGDRRETKYLKDFAYHKAQPLERKLREQ